MPEMAVPSVQSIVGMNKSGIQPPQAKTFWSPLHYFISVCAELNWILTVSIRQSPNFSSPSGNKKVNHSFLYHWNVPLAFICFLLPTRPSRADESTDKWHRKAAN